MVDASDLRGGMIIRIEGQIYKILEVASKAGVAKTGGVVKTKLINLKTGRMWEPHFRPQERLEDLELERRTMQYLYTEGDVCTFMRPDTFEQIEISGSILGIGKEFLQPGMEMPAEFFEGEPISVVVPDVTEVLVAATSPPAHSQQDSAWKEATLDNGLSIRVPLFIAIGDIVRIDVRTGRYIERARTEHKRSA